MATALVVGAVGLYAINRMTHVDLPEFEHDTAHRRGDYLHKPPLHIEVSKIALPTGHEYDDVVHGGPREMNAWAKDQEYDVMAAVNDSLDRQWSLDARAATARAWHGDDEQMGFKRRNRHDATIPIIDWRTIPHPEQDAMLATGVMQHHGREEHEKMNMFRTFRPETGLSVRTVYDAPSKKL